MYKGTDQIHAANGTGMRIEHIGHALIHTPDRTLHLKNILYVPQAKKNLIYASRLAEDNHVFLEIHSKYFFLLRIGSRRTQFLKGGVKGASIIFLPTSPRKLSVSCHPLQDGTIVSVIHLPPLLQE